MPFSEFTVQHIDLPVLGTFRVGFVNFYPVRLHTQLGCRADEVIRTTSDIQELDLYKS